MNIEKVFTELGRAIIKDALNRIEKTNPAPKTHAKITKTNNPNPEPHNQDQFTSQKPQENKTEL